MSYDPSKLVAAIEELMGKTGLSMSDRIVLAMAAREIEIYARPVRTIQVVDWTTSADGVANSSPAFQWLVDVIARIIRNGAHDLLQGRSETTARTILAKLAHEHGLAPRGAIDPRGSVGVGGEDKGRSSP